jgi:SAM-dependent methyltransferase
MERTAFNTLQAMERSWWYRGRARVVSAALRNVGVRNAQRILDFGSGFGGMYDALATIGKNVYAFEPDREAEIESKKRGYTAIYPTAEQALAQQYDLIGLFDVLEHIEKDRDFLIAAHAALAERGTLAITVPAFQFLWSEHDVSHHHFRRYTTARLREDLHATGYEIAYIGYWNMILFAPAYLARMLNRSGESSFGLPKIIDAILYACVCIEAFFIRYIPLPFGVSVITVARKI